MFGINYDFMKLYWISSVPHWHWRALACVNYGWLWRGIMLHASVSIYTSVSTCRQSVHTSSHTLADRLSASSVEVSYINYMLMAQLIWLYVHFSVYHILGYDQRMCAARNRLHASCPPYHISHLYAWFLRWCCRPQSNNIFVYSAQAHSIFCVAARATACQRL